MNTTATYPKIIFLLLVICALSFVVFSPSSLCCKITYAATEVSPNIDRDTLWTKANSPYLAPYINVAKDAALTIEPGVIVKLDGGSFNVFGTLKAEGSPENHIYFTSAKDDEWGGDTNGDSAASIPKSDSWRGITINGSSTSMLSNIDMRYARSGLILRNASTTLNSASISKSGYGVDANSSILSLKNFHAFDMYGDGIGAYDKSIVSVSSSTIDRIFTQASGIGLFGSSTGYFDHVMIKNTRRGGNGISVFGSSAIVSDSTIRDSEDSYGCGIYISEDGYPSMRPHLSVSSTTVENFGCGIGVNGGIFRIQSAVIRSNELGIFTFGNPSPEPSVISQSIISDNTESGIENYGQMTIDARNNWWGDASGPFSEASNASGVGNRIIDAADRTQFSPWLKLVPGAKPACCSNIIFIPGLEGSSLFSRNGSSSEKQLWVPPIATSIKNLYLDENGKSIGQNIYAKEAISSAYGQDIYKTFMAKMDSLVLGRAINAWKALPYDWRRDVLDIAEDATILGQIESMASTSQTGKVTLLSHSNGGLIAKFISNILKGKNKEDLVDKMIMVASPQLGTPAGMAAVLHGENQALGHGIVLTARGARGLGINMPGAYGLLPSLASFSGTSSPIVQFDVSVDQASNLRKVYGSIIASSSSLHDFLVGKDGRPQAAYNDLFSPSVLRPALLAQAEANHSSIDSWVPFKDMRTYQIAGWGLPTIESIKYAGIKRCASVARYCDHPYALDHKSVETADGDGTVVSSSATAVPGVDNFYFNLQESKKKNTDRAHSDILEAKPVQSLIENIVTDAKGMPLPEFITTTKPTGSHMLEVSVHSPVSLDVYDVSGNHTGLAKVQYEESDLVFIDRDIPNSYYRESGEGKYVRLDFGETYSAMLQGKDFGTFTLRLSEIIDDQEVASTSFVDIPVSSNTKASFDFKNVTDVKTLSVDVDGDGTVDQIVGNSETPDPVAQIDSLMILLQSIDTKSSFLQGVLGKLRVTKGFLEKKDNGKALDMLTTIEDGLSKSKEKKISQDQAWKIIGIIEMIKLNIDPF